MTCNMYLALPPSRLEHRPQRRQRQVERPVVQHPKPLHQPQLVQCSELVQHDQPILPPGLSWRPRDNPW